MLSDQKRKEGVQPINGCSDTCIEREILVKELIQSIPTSKDQIAFQNMWNRRSRFRDEYILWAMLPVPGLQHIYLRDYSRAFRSLLLTACCITGILTRDGLFILLALAAVSLQCGLLVKDVNQAEVRTWQYNRKCADDLHKEIASRILIDTSKENRSTDGEKV